MSEELVRFGYTKNDDMLYAIDDSNELFMDITGKTSRTLNQTGALYDDIVVNTNQEVLYTHGVFIGKKQDLSNLVTKEEFGPISESINDTIKKNTLATINNQSLEKGGNIDIDINLYVLVDELPTENINDNKIYLLPNHSGDSKNSYDEYSYKSGSWELLGEFKSEINLSGYLKKDEAEKLYMKLSNGSGSISINQSTGSMSNFGPNGQAYNAVRDCGSTSITGKPLNGGAFGVKLDGTTAFTHKTYDTFNTTTGTYTGAKNTAVLTFSGPSGLRYAKNTGSANDVTDAMYKYVGVIDSPDENLKVYSAKQVDEIVNLLLARIEALENKQA